MAAVLGRYLVHTAESEGRVILTGDRLFVRRRLSNHTFFVHGADKREQLADVLASFDLKVEATDMLSRCAKCNGHFLPRQDPALCAQVPFYTPHVHDDVASVSKSGLMLWLSSVDGHGR